MVVLNENALQKKYNNCAQAKSTKQVLTFTIYSTPRVVAATEKSVMAPLKT